MFFMSIFWLSFISAPLLLLCCCGHFKHSWCWEQFDDDVLGSSMVKCWSVWWQCALQWQYPRLFNDDVLSSSWWCVSSLMIMCRCQCAGLINSNVLGFWWQCTGLFGDDVPGSLMVMWQTPQWWCASLFHDSVPDSSMVMCSENLAATWKKLARAEDFGGNTIRLFGVNTLVLFNGYFAGLADKAMPFNKSIVK